MIYIIFNDNNKHEKKTWQNAQTKRRWLNFFLLFII